MRVLKYLIVFLVILLAFSCVNTQERIIKESETKNIPDIIVRPLHYQEYKIDTVFYNDKIKEGYGTMSGFVLFVDGSGDTVKGIHADKTKTYIHVMGINLNQRVDGMYNLLLPVGDYKICVEANGFFPVVNNVKIRNKEEQITNYYIDRK